MLSEEKHLLFDIEKKRDEVFRGAYVARKKRILHYAQDGKRRASPEQSEGLSITESALAASC